MCPRARETIELQTIRYYVAPRRRSRCNDTNTLCAQEIKTVTHHKYAGIPGAIVMYIVTMLRADCHLCQPGNVTLNSYI